MNTTTTTITLSRQRPDRRVLWILMLAVLLIGLTGVVCLSQLVLRLLTPTAAVYPHSLLALYGANYRPWDQVVLPNLPPLAPQAAMAAELDLNTDGAAGIVPVALA